MNKLPANFCIAPFTQHTTHPTKSFSPCPYLGGTVWDKQYPSIIDQWTSDDLEILRQDFLENKKNQICFRCWNEEKNNKKSLRLRLFDPINLTSDYNYVNTPGFINDTIKSIDNKTYTKSPRVLTIKNGNLCNAKCRVCHPGDSSRWIEDANKLYKLTGKKFYQINQETTNWSDSQIDEILQLSQNLVRLELFGGEPTYNKKIEGLLNRIIESGNNKNITLYINTNGSVNFIERIPNIHKFKQIEIGVSFDGYDDIFSYIRHGLDFDEVVKNVKTWQTYFKEHNTDFWIDSISTVSVFNVFYLPELKQKIMEFLPLSPYWNLLIAPAYLSIQNMPQLLKDKTIEKLANDPDFSELINVMNQPADNVQWNKFLEITSSLDLIRNENFKNTFPELAQILYTSK